MTTQSPEGTDAVVLSGVHGPKKVGLGFGTGMAGRMVPEN